jgi:hypothetical protein
MAYAAYEIKFVSPVTGAGGFVVPQGVDKVGAWSDDATALLCQQLLEYECGWQTELRMLTAWEVV